MTAAKKPRSSVEVSRTSQKTSGNSSQAESRVDSSEVDVDSLTVKILLLVKDTLPMDQAAAYLNRRGWPTVSYNNLNKAIAYIAQNKPDFVFISLNHPNPNISRLPLLLENTFKTTCVAFSERGDSATLLRLKKAKLKHKMNQMASGTSIQRTIRKILMEQYGQASEQESESASRSEGDSAATRIRNSSAEDEQIKVKSRHGTDNSIRISGSDEENNSISIEGESTNLAGERKGQTSHDSGEDGWYQSSGYRARKKKPYTMESAPIEQTTPNPKSQYDRSAGHEGAAAYSQKDKAFGSPKNQSAEDENLSTQQLLDLIRQNQDEQERQGKDTKGDSEDEAFKGRQKDRHEDNNYWGEQAGESSAQTPWAEAAKGQRGEQGNYLGEGDSGHKETPFYDQQDGQESANTLAEGDESAPLHSLQQDGSKGDYHRADKEEQKAKGNSQTQNRTSESEAQAAATQGSQVDLTGAKFNAAQKRKTAQVHGPGKKQRSSGFHETHGPAQTKQPGIEKDASAAKTQGAANRELSEEETGLYKSVYSALESLDSEEASDVGALSIKSVDTLGVVPVESGELHGFMIVSMVRTDLLTKDNALSEIQGMISEKMKLAGEENHFDDSFLIKVPAVNFIRWAKEHAAFTFTHSFMGSELGVAFLPTRNQFPCRNSSKVENMAKINVDDISPSQAVTFKAYLYLEKNEKQLLYLRDGRVILPRQKESLRSKDITDFHIEEDDIRKFKTYLAETVINELIDAFED